MEVVDDAGERFEEFVFGGTALVAAVRASVRE